jgi:hypothetical protein
VELYFSLRLHDVRRDNLHFNFTAVRHKIFSPPSKLNIVVLQLKFQLRIQDVSVAGLDQ